MERNRKLLVSILALLVLSCVIAIVDITLNMKKPDSPVIRAGLPDFGPGIAVVRIEGAIEMATKSGPLGVKSGSEAVIKRVDDIMKNSSIKAVVVRINSPGGSVAATQEIYEKIWKLRKKNIPLVASMGEVAASGGYYVASACNEIFANHGTITGSIGVIAFSPNLKKLFDKLGISMNVIKSGRHKDIMSSHRDISPQERKMLQQIIDTSYNKFLKDVALGRNMNQSDIKPYADGRIITGVEAARIKLIDSIGTFEDAIFKAKKLADLPEDCPVYEKAATPFEEFMKKIQNIFSGAGFIEGSLNHMENYRVQYRYSR